MGILETKCGFWKLDGEAEEKGWLSIPTNPSPFFYFIPFLAQRGPAFFPRESEDSQDGLLLKARHLPHHYANLFSPPILPKARWDPDCLNTGKGFQQMIYLVCNSQYV